MKLITTSWDDGHPLDNRIAELLDKYSLAGTFYIPRKNTGHRIMEENNVTEISMRFEVGGHTLNHVDLGSAGRKEAEYEVKGCYEWLAGVTGSLPVSFCLPFGNYTQENLSMIYESGFKVVRTTVMLSPHIKLPLADTTLQVFNHSGFTFLKHLGKRRLVKAGWLWMKGGCETDMLRLADYYINHIDNNGGCFHLYGHSWEIEKFNLWNKLEALFRHISNRDGYAYIPNRDLVNYS